MFNHSIAQGLHITNYTTEVLCFTTSQHNLQCLPNSAVTASKSSFVMNSSLGDTPLPEYPCHGHDAVAPDFSFGDTITSSVTENSSVLISGEQTWSNSDLQTQYMRITSLDFSHMATAYKTVTEIQLGPSHHVPSRFLNVKIYSFKTVSWRNPKVT